MPAFLAKENANGVSSNAVLMTTLLVQVALAATLLSKDAFTLMLSLCSHLSLLPYLLSAAFLLKLVLSRQTYPAGDPDHGKDRIIAVLAVVYSVFLVYAGGLKFLVLSFLIYAPGTVLYLKTRREQSKQLFTPAEWFAFGVVLVGAVYALYGLITGAITI
jgi:arginine:ornithine antiporter/lysine permease